MSKRHDFFRISWHDLHPSVNTSTSRLLCRAKAIPRMVTLSMPLFSFLYCHNLLYVFFFISFLFSLSIIFFPFSFFLVPLFLFFFFISLILGLFFSFLFLFPMHPSITTFTVSRNFIYHSIEMCEVSSWMQKVDIVQICKKTEIFHANFDEFEYVQYRNIFL